MTRGTSPQLRRDESRQRVRRVSVQVVPCAVIPTRRPGVGMSRGVLDVSEARSRVQAQGHEGVSEVMRVEGVGLLGDGRPREPSEGLPRP